MAVLLKTCSQLRHFISIARQIPRDCVSLQIQRSSIPHHLTRYLATAAHNYETNEPPMVSKSVSESTHIDEYLLKLDSDIKRYGQVRKLDLMKICESINNSASVSSIQSLYLIRCCGSLLSHEVPVQRTEFVHEVWRMLENFDVVLDASHYNALLKVYLENGHPFSPTEFLTSMMDKGVIANRVTYQRIIEQYCRVGDVAGASSIVEHMKELGMAVNESVFNSLILGHARAKDMDGAKEVMEVMRQKGLVPSLETYATLACGYAENGNIEEYKNTMKLADLNQFYISPKIHLQLISSLAVGGHHEYIDEIIESIDYTSNKALCISSALTMASKGLEDTAFKVLGKVLSPTYTHPSESFIKIVLMNDNSLETLLMYARHYLNSGLNDQIFESSAKCAMQLKKRDYAFGIFKEMKMQGIPLKVHYFWPIFAQCRNEGNEEELWACLCTLTELGLIADMDTYIKFILPGITTTNMDEVICKIKEIGQPEALAVDSLFVHYMKHNKEFSLDILSKYDVKPNVIQAVNLLTNNFEDVSYVMQLLEHLHNSGVGSYDSVYGLFLQRVIELFPDNIDLHEKYFQEYKQKNIMLPQRFIDSITERIKFLAPDLLIYLSHADKQSSYLPDGAFIHPMQLTLGELEERLIAANDNGNNRRPILRHMLSIFCKNKNYERVLQTMAELDNLDYTYSPATCVMLLNHFVSFNNVEEACKFKDILTEHYPHFELDAAKGVDFVTLLLKSGKIEDALRIAETEATKWRPADQFIEASVKKLLNTAANTGDVEITKKFLDIFLFDLKVIRASSYSLEPLVHAHLSRGDFDAAIDEYEDLVVKYKTFPCRNELFKQFIALRDHTRLQKVVDISTLHNGKIFALHELAYAFVESGCLQEARKVTQTLGKSADIQCLNMICQRLAKSQRVKELLQFISISKDLTHIGRDQLYSHLLRLYDERNDYQAALEMWNIMQEENVQPSSDTLNRLSILLERNNQPVPFAAPSQNVVSPELLNYIKDKNEFEVIKTLKSMKKGEIHLLTVNHFMNIVDLLLEKGFLKELKGIVQAMSVILAKPSDILKPLFRKYAEAGDIDSVKELFDFLPEFAHKHVSCNTYVFEAYLVSGKANELLSLLEKNMTTSRKLFSVQKFLKLLKDYPELEERALHLADLFDKENFETPKVALWQHYLLQENYEKAEEIFKAKSRLILVGDRCFLNVIRAVKNDKNLTLGRKLVDLANASMKHNIKQRAYNCLLGALVHHSKLDEALALMEEAKQFDITTANFYIPILRSLEKSLLEKNMTVPFKVGTEDAALSSGSSSSDESD